MLKKVLRTISPLESRTVTGSFTRMLCTFIFASDCSTESCLT